MRVSYRFYHYPIGYTADTHKMSIHEYRVFDIEPRRGIYRIISFFKWAVEMPLNPPTEPIDFLHNLIVTSYTKNLPPHKDTFIESTNHFGSKTSIGGFHGHKK